MNARRRGVAFVLALVVVGLACWFVYLAVQPHDYTLPGADPRFLRTIFGWDAPGIERRQIVLPDRSWISLVGWTLAAFAAGWTSPRRWRVVGPALVLPSWVLYWPTAPRDIDGMWGSGIVFLPALACGISFVARWAGTLRARVLPASR